jgi:hypothetical protein
MPTIKPSADYGIGDLAVMSIETDELLSEKKDLYTLIEEGLDDVRQNRVKSADEVLATIRLKMGY